MKKLVVVTLALLLVGGLTFAQEGELIFRGAVGIMYIQPMAGFSELDYSAFRAGVHGDLMYNLGRFEIGGEIGLYMMEIETWYGYYYYYSYYSYFFAMEIPVNALFRLNFDQNRMFAIEARGGLWLSMVTDGYITLTDVDANIGARAVLGVFYIGADYRFGLNYQYPAIIFEAGLKIAFE